MSFLSHIQKHEERTFDHVISEAGQDLQRTEQWFQDRLGRFTGSKMKDLMSCSRSSSKLGWNEPVKIIDFGQTAIKYIYNVAQERRTQIGSMEVNSRNFSHGKEFEPLLIEQMLMDGVLDHYEEVPFMKFPGIDYAGASPDGKGFKNDQVLAMETKATVSWDGHFARFGDYFHEKHNDFWQVTAEMISLKSKKAIFVAAYPGQSEKYDTVIVELSHVHKWALLQRLKVAEDAVQRFLEKDGKKKIFECVEEACANYEF